MGMFAPIFNNNQGQTNGNGQGSKTYKASPNIFMGMYPMQPGPCGPAPCQEQLLNAPIMLLFGRCKNTAPISASSYRFSDVNHHFGPPLTAARNRAAEEIDTFSNQAFAGAFVPATNNWIADITQTAADPFFQEPITYSGVNFNSIDNRIGIGSFELFLESGDLTTPAPVLSTSWIFEPPTASLITNIYVFAPLIRFEINNDRTILNRVVLDVVNNNSFGIRWRIENVPNNPAYTMQAKFLNRGVPFAMKYARSIGAV